MEITRLSCRLCLSQTEFSVSLFSNYSNKTNMLEKISTCYNLVVKESDHLVNICYICAANIEKFYDSITQVRKSQEKICESVKSKKRSQNIENKNKCVASAPYAREQVKGADYTFSFLDVSFSKEVCEEPKKSNSSALFSYFSPNNDHKWKTPKTPTTRFSDGKIEKRTDEKRQSRRRSKDLFESPSQDVEDEVRNISMDWKLTPDDNVMRRLREKCFGRSDF